MISENTAMRKERPENGIHDSADPGIRDAETVNEGGQLRGEIVRIRKQIVLRPEVGVRVDSTMVGPQFYDCFNYALLANGEANTNVAVGVSSANPGEGKTLVASNLAISLTVAYQRKTVLVDMNLQKPRIHEIFDVPVGPGLLEAIGGGSIPVARTAISDLFVLTTGVTNAGFAGGLRFAMADGDHTLEPSLQLEQIAAFRDVLYSLREHFDFVIVDMPSLREHLVPLLFTNQLDGVLLVVHGGLTKQAELDHALQIVNERRILGFVFNGAERVRATRRQRK